MAALLYLTACILATAHVCCALDTAVNTSCPNGNQILRRNKLSCGNKQYIVDFHNKIRSHVASGRIDGQPKAANMEEMSWNQSLADLAQKRADTCDFNHGDLELYGERIGQNLALLTSSLDNLRLNLTYMIELWYNEVFQFGYNGEFDIRTGHYSQLIWGSSREVGCGYTYYEEDGWFKMYLVCDYFPPGNYFGQKPYVYGKLDCKSYGLSDSSKYPKLCANDNAKVSVCKSEKLVQENDNSTTELNLQEVTNSIEFEEMESSESPDLEIMGTMAPDYGLQVDESTTLAEDMERIGTTDQAELAIEETTRGRTKAKFYLETVLFGKNDLEGGGGTFSFEYEPSDATGGKVQIDGVRVSNETLSLAAKLIQLLASFRL